MARTKESAVDVALYNTREALKKGLSVCVFGMLTKNMDDFIRTLPEKRVQIIHDTKKNPHQNTGIVLLPASVHHADSKRLIDKGFNVFNVALQPSGIKRVLRGCLDLLRAEAQRPVIETPKPAEPSPVEQLSQLVAKIVSNTPPPIEYPENMRAFAKAFALLADENGGIVPSRSVVELSDEHKTEGLIRLTKCGWITGVVLDGKVRITAYQATSKLLDVAHQHTDEEEMDEVGRAMQIIAEEPELLKQLQSITERLQLIRQLKGFLTSINDAVKGS